MAYQPRNQSAQCIFHVISRGNNRGPVFGSDPDYVTYLALLDIYRRKYSMKVYHFVLMPNHVHLLIEPTIDHTISKFMQGITLAYTTIVNNREGRKGHIWHGRYKSLLIERESYLLECGRYIELNPVRAGLVQHPKDYPWSSYNYLMAGRRSKLIDLNPFYELFGIDSQELRSNYKHFVEEALPEKLKKPVSSEK